MSVVVIVTVSKTDTVHGTEQWEHYVFHNSLYIINTALIIFHLIFVKNKSEMFNYRIYMHSDWLYSPACTNSDIMLDENSLIAPQKSSNSFSAEMEN